MASGHLQTGHPGESTRIFDMSFTASLLAEHHRRCHDCAEYLAQVAAPAGSDTAMTARELSACLFEVLELISAHHRPGLIEVTLVSHEGRVEVRTTLPADEALALEYSAWLETPLEARDAFKDPRPGDGLLELAAVHNAEVFSQREDEDRLTLVMHVSLKGGEEA